MIHARDDLYRQAVETLDALDAMSPIERWFALRLLDAAGLLFARERPGTTIRELRVIIAEAPL